MTGTIIFPLTAAWGGMEKSEEVHVMRGADSGQRTRTVGGRAKRRQKHNSGVTEFAELPGRGHSPTIDGGWAEVAQTALDFIKWFT